MHGQIGKYAPLCQYLEQLPADQQTVALLLPEIEALTGERLPPTARTSSSWWTTSVTARHNWQRSGWLARFVRPLTVTFTRLPRPTP